MNSLVLSAFLPVSVCVFAFSARARNGYFTSRNMILSCEGNSETKALLCALEFAEDHRYRSHFGIDPIAIVRAVTSILVKKRLEGASTIEQQYVRTCTGNVEVSLTRKLEELSIAVWIAMLARKDDIAYSYLKYAYFGRGLYGYRSAMCILSEEEYGAANSPHGAAAVVSLLKRPRPASEEIGWKIKHQRRVKYVLMRQFGVGANDSLR